MSAAHKGKVLYLHRTQEGGAEQVHILGIVRAFEAAGVPVDILSPRGFERVRNDSSGAKPAGGGKTHPLFALVSRYAPELLFELLEIAYNALALWRVAKNGIGGYQLVFERYAVFGVAGAVIARLAKLPLVVEVNYTSRSPLVRRRSRLMKPLAHLVDRWIFSSATVLTPVSTYLKMELMRDFGVPEEKIVVLPNAADPEKFVPHSARQETGEQKVIGFVGGFYPWHGLDLLVEAYAGIAGDFPESRVLLIGDGPELENIRALVARLGLADRVIFGGRKAHAELPGVMSRFYCGVMPDSNDYGSPMKIFEYMALGVPVVAPDYGPILDAVVDGEHGVVFEKRNVAALRQALVRLLRDEQLTRRLGRRCRETVVRERNWNANVARIRAALDARQGSTLPLEGGISHDRP